MSFLFLPPSHWPGPRSLATTNGVSFDVLSSGYLDVSVPRVSSLSGDLTVGFPHSEILGSKLIRSSPRLIAAYYVLHRLHTPRHPLDALKTLDRSHYQCPQYHKSHPLLYGQDLHHRADVLYPTHHCIGLIGQIKKTRIHVRPLFLPEGVGSNRQCRISLRCPNIRSWNPTGSTQPNFALFHTHVLSAVAALWRDSLRSDPACRAEAAKQRRLVEPDGIEPTTSCLQSRRSPS